MRILYILEHYYPYVGGSERLFQDLAEKLASEGHHVSVITSRFDPLLDESENINGVRVFRLGRNRFWFTLLSIPAIFRKARHADIIHTTTYNAALPTWIATRFLKKKVILTFHEVWGKLWFKLPFARWWERILFFTFEKLVLFIPFDHYIAVSEYTRNSLINSGISQNKVTLIYNGIQYEELSSFKYDPPLPPPFKLLYFGRLGISKGINLILDAMSRLYKENAPIQLIMVVPTAPKGMWNKINAKIDQEGIREMITFQHHLEREQLFKLITSCHAVLVPSYSEGFCFTAVESSALGVPVIHSGRGALSEVMAMPGFKVMTGDALYGAIQDFISEERYPGERQWDALHFPIKRTTEETLKLYKKIGVS